MREGIGAMAATQEHSTLGVSPDRLLHMIAESLCTEYREETGLELAGPSEFSLLWSNADVRSVIIQLQCPSFALAHEKGESSHNDRNQTKEYALSLLNRPLLWQPETGNATLLLEQFSKLKYLLLQNVYDSFKILVDSRLHAYATFLARHGLTLVKKHIGHNVDSLACLEQKIQVLLQLGEQIEAHCISINFEVVDSDVMEEDDTSNLELEIVVKMEIRLPRPGKASQLIPTTIRVSGSIIGKSFLWTRMSLATCTLHILFLLTATTDETSTSTIQVKADMSDFLSIMMEKASEIASTIVEITNSAFASDDEDTKAELKKNSESFVVMPPPPPIASRQLDRTELLGLELLSQTAMELPIVSPDISARSSPGMQIPDLALESDVEDLSPDECAVIVDGVFEEINGVFPF
jgi:hypothetical protein